MTMLDEFLEHYGVKGMKWGVRNDRGHEGERTKTKKIAKLDKKFEKSDKSQALAIKTWNTACQAANNDLPGINDRYRGQDLSDPQSPQSQRYYTEVLQNMNGHLNQAGRSLGTNASGTRRIEASLLVDGDGDPYGVHMAIVDVEHMDMVEALSAKFVFDDAGFIVKIDPPKVLSQLDPLGEFLEHYGVKGMKWGKRKARSDEGARARQLKVRKASTLSNAELKFLNERLNLETNYNRLNPSIVSRGRSGAAAIIGTIGLGVTAYNLATSPAARAGRQFLLGATAAAGGPAIPNRLVDF